MRAYFQHHGLFGVNPLRSPLSCKGFWGFWVMAPSWICSFFFLPPSPGPLVFPNTIYYRETQQCPALGAAELSPAQSTGHTHWNPASPEHLSEGTETKLEALWCRNALLPHLRLSVMKGCRDALPPPQTGIKLAEGKHQSRQGRPQPRPSPNLKHK